MSHAGDVSETQNLRLDGGGLRWGRLLRAWLADRSRPWEPFYFESIPLPDAFLTPMDSAFWLDRLVRHFASTGPSFRQARYRQVDRTSEGVALALATDASVRRSAEPDAVCFLCHAPSGRPGH